MSKRTVEFEFDLYDRVNTPLVDNGMISMLGYDDMGIVYFVENNIQGVANRWWKESKLVLAE